ncbi:hypothetical protein GPLA_1779 [Paraglaciecola polaris LMG 21857]|uniref:Uncharacterized protein n=1 Tax=Paraglaciecola polaris LMG 21857 TaxID=1129793 RepID=K6YIX5_9ALTE|nr:hypothetical protein GPLA_1779 [Paraglaciecola polaris LMG 21857]
MTSLEQAKRSIDESSGFRYAQYIAVNKLLKEERELTCAA